MRLLNTETLKPEWFVPSLTPPYAILSHTWGDDEVTLQEIESIAPELLQQRKGFAKIQDACRYARENGHSYIWIDTCCIDKTSSAELSETIVSMFKWYQKSVVCYAFLADFVGDTSLSITGEQLETCRWFKRGWTVQELIASENVTFVNAEWKIIGTKAALRGVLEDLTGIPATILTGEKPLRITGVEDRIRWVVDSRETTREEDMAYCLVGLLDISMPAIYGEGREWAFKRLRSVLQLENDQVQAMAAAGIPQQRQRREALPRVPWDDFEQSFSPSELDLHLRTLRYDDSNLDDPQSWANLGDGALELDDEIEGCFERPHSIDLCLSSRRYGPTAGIRPLRAAMANLYNKHHRLGYASQFTWENVCILPGPRAALQRIALALGHGMLGIFVPDICASHDIQSLFRRFRISPIPLHDEGYGIGDICCKEIRRGTTVFLAPNPEPVMPLSTKKYELRKLQDICRERVTLIMDESMSGFNYANDCDGTTTSAAENIEDVESDDVFIIDGLANRFRLPGWHVSWILGSKEHIKAIASQGSSLDDGTSVAFQEGCIPMLEPLKVTKETQALQIHFRDKRDYVVKRLKSMGFVIEHIPTCTFYVWLDVEGMPWSINNGLKFYHAVHACLEKQVIVIPGILFDFSLAQRRKPEDSPCYHRVRLSFGPSMEVLKMGLDKIEQLIKERKPFESWESD